MTNRCRKAYSISGTPRPTSTQHTPITPCQLQYAVAPYCTPLQQTKPLYGTRKQQKQTVAADQTMSGAARCCNKYEPEEATTDGHGTRQETPILLHKVAGCRSGGPPAGTSLTLLLCSQSKSQDPLPMGWRLRGQTSAAWGCWRHLHKPPAPLQAKGGPTGRRRGPHAA